MAEVVSEDLQNNTNKFWFYVNNKGQGSLGVAPLKYEDGCSKSDRQSKTEILNNQFHIVFTKENMEDFPDMGPNPLKTISIRNVFENYCRTINHAKQLIEESRECHNQKPQPIPDTKRKTISKAC